MILSVSYSSFYNCDIVRYRSNITDYVNGLVNENGAGLEQSLTSARRRFPPNFELIPPGMPLNRN